MIVAKQASGTIGLASLSVIVSTLLASEEVVGLVGATGASAMELPNGAIKLSDAAIDSLLSEPFSGNSVIANSDGGEKINSVCSS